MSLWQAAVEHFECELCAGQRGEVCVTVKGGRPGTRLSSPHACRLRAAMAVLEDSGYWQAYQSASAARADAYRSLKWILAGVDRAVAGGQTNTTLDWVLRAFRPVVVELERSWSEG